MAQQGQSKASEQPLKKVKNLVIRNLLCAPKEDEWPRLPDQEALLVKKELKKHLVLLNVPRLKKPWREMKKLNKEGRKLYAQQLEEARPAEELKAVNEAKQLRSWLFIGINAVSRALESDAAACCLLAEDVSPPSLVKHVVQLALNFKVPVFIVGGFKKFCKEVIGFPCIALGIAKPCNPDTKDRHLFVETCRLVEKLFLAWDKKRETWKQSKASASPADQSKLQEKPDPVSIPEPAAIMDTDDDPPPAGKQHTTTQTTEAQDLCNFFSLSSNFHLTRRSKYERTFVPSTGVDNEDLVTESAPQPLADVTPQLAKKSFGMSLTKYKMPTILRVRNKMFKMKRKKKKKKSA
ncbi:Hypothetical protein NTJ_00508 [Nesidiocoris tenuis]|uniref:Ribosomal protein eL8/eL30/eS12/Gadd45 domain-containing protein n=1 Tax=Nesidiocoris tenuis TaxID=355587 RepID=A0ABN7A6Y8_9HEMI|nr:Hypothetical protein NTJ_00508 [Nesidiocoris tenuis]